MGFITAISDGFLAFSDFMWSMPILVLLIVAGILCTVSSDFMQVKHLPFVLKKTVGSAFTGSQEGKVKGIQAMTAALAATIGTGNIVGVGTAIAVGGPGAIFWMWVIGFIAMSLKFSEAILSVATRVKDENGKWKGGAYRYLSEVWKPLGFIFGFAEIYVLAFSCGAHAGSVETAASNLGLPKMVTTILLVVVVGLIIVGGLSALIKITDKLVPIMTIIYVGAGIIIILMNIGNLFPAIGSIFAGAFSGAAPVGGFTGAALSATIKNGCARGVYSSDAGNGCASFLHAQADIDSPVEQGMYGVLEVFLDTIVVCTFSALVILSTGIWQTGDPGSVLAINAFTNAFGTVGQIVSSICLMLFAASTIFSFTTTLGLLAMDMFGTKVRLTAQALLLISVALGCTIGVDKFLPYVDGLNAVQIPIHLAGVLLLTPRIKKMVDEYFAK